MPQGMNVEAKAGETVRHNVGGTGETRALKIGHSSRGSHPDGAWLRTSMGAGVASKWQGSRRGFQVAGDQDAEARREECSAAGVASKWQGSRRGFKVPGD